MPGSTLSKKCLFPSAFEVCLKTLNSNVEMTFHDLWIFEEEKAFEAGKRRLQVVSLFLLGWG